MGSLKFVKVITVLCILALLGGAVFANGDQEEALSKSANGQKSMDNISIGYCSYGAATLTYITVLDSIFKEEAEKMGVKLMIADAAGDPVKQEQQLESMIQRKPDVIMIVPINAKAIIPKVKEAYEKGIKVNIVNSRIDPEGVQYTTAFTGPDVQDGAEMAAEILARATGGKAKIIEIPGLPGYDVTIQKTQGFADGISKYPGMEIIDSQPGDYSRAKTQKIMEDFIIKYKPGEFDAVYVPNDDCAAGVINALKTAGRLEGVNVIASTHLGNGYDMIKSGEMLGSVIQSPVEDAKLALQTAILVAAGGEVPKEKFFENIIVTKDNIDQIGKVIW